MRLPTDDEIHAQALLLGLLDPDGTLPARNRGRAAKAAAAALAAAESAQRPGPATAPSPAGTLLSRSVVQVAGGHLVIDVTHYPADTRPS